MGLFSFGKPSLPKTTNKVWMNRRACLQGMILEASSQNSGIQTAIVTLFEESHNNLIHLLDASNVAYEIVTSLGKSEERAGKLHILKGPSIGSPFGNHTPAKGNFLILGRYPYAVTENALIEKLASLYPGSGITFCLSLDDSIFEVFGSGNLKPLMEKLGMKEDESIEHSMINKAVSNALDKINKNLVVELSSRSEKDWFSRNVIQ